jgi:hypothetical protein
MVEGIDVMLVRVLIDLVLLLIDDLPHSLLFDSYAIILIWIFVGWLFWAASFIISRRGRIDLFFLLGFGSTYHTLIFKILLFNDIGVLDTILHLAVYMILNQYIYTQRSQLSHPIQFSSSYALTVSS